MIEHFNWVDVGVIIVILRICYIALKNGIITEFFKLAGTASGIYLSFHYYTSLSDFVMAQLSAQRDTVFPFMDFVILVGVAAAGYLIFVVLRETFLHFIKSEALPVINKYGGLILGIARASLLVSLIIFGLVISTVDYLKASVRDSYSGSRLLAIAPAVYTFLWDTVGSKFSVKNDFNKTILEVQEDFHS